MTDEKKLERAYSLSAIGEFLEDFLEASALGDFSWHTRHWVSFSRKALGSFKTLPPCK
jgi:hypothetical protein